LKQSKNNLDQHESEKDLFEDIAESQQPERKSEHTRKRSSVGRFPIRTPSPRKSRDMSGNGKGKGGGTVLGLDSMKQVEGRGKLSRIVQDKDGKDVFFDFWNDVGKHDSDRLDAILSIAVMEKEYDLASFIRGIEYQGFDRLYYIKVALAKMSVSLFCRFAILGAIRGSNFTKVVETCEIMPQDMISGFTSLGFVKTPKKRDHLTILRCTASIPHWCSYFLAKAEVEKKLQLPCPASLQFPGAASLPMSKSVRIQHLEFCVAFSSLLPGGTFNFNIYQTAMSNQIPIVSIPQEVLLLLEVSSSSESHSLTEDEKSIYGKQVAIRK
jgi:hypothetical protein